MQRANPFRHLALVAVAATLGGCATLNGARPLSPGQHEVGLTLGGPFVEFGSAAIPVPSAMLEGRSGVAILADRPLDLNYGLNVTGLPFGILELHLGASWLLVHQDDAIPAVSWTNRLFFATNVLGADSKADGAVGAWGMWQFEFTASWMFGEQLLYIALAQYLDFGNPEATITPALGATFDLDGDPGGARLQLELRYYAVSLADKGLTNVAWVPSGNGALGLSLGVSYAFF